MLPSAGSAAAASGSERQNHPNGISASCSAYLPADATVVDSFRLCRSDHAGQGRLYACAHFVSANGKYRVLFSGGRHPAAIVRLATAGEVDKLFWSKGQQSNQPTCDFPPPAQLPTGTTFIGAGVCEDEQGRSVPCAVFRDKLPQRTTISDHMVYYRPDGLGPHDTSIIHLSVNEDSAPAQLAFQIGLALLKTSCCQQRGLKYIEQAYRLFPASIVYRSAYQHSGQQAINGAPTKSWSENNGESR